MNQKERSSYDTILQILKSDATLLADSVVDNIMATQREKIKSIVFLSTKEESISNMILLDE